MKIYEITSNKSDIYYHASDDPNLDIGDTLEWKGANKQASFGDYEKILEQFRPDLHPSRYSSFYLSRDKDTAERLGGWYLYKVSPVGMHTTHYLGWIGILISFIEADGYKKDYGYVIDNLTHKTNETVEYICTSYWSGKEPSKLDIKNFKYTVDIETFMTETLASKITILDKYFS